MAIRVIFLDVDGTLTNSQKEITPKTLEALLKVQKAGVKLVLSSGRPDRGLLKWATQLKMMENNGFFVCFNGGKVINCQTKEVYFNKALDIQDAKAILNHLKNFDVVPMIDKDEYMYVTDVFNHDIQPELSHLPKTYNIMQYEARSNNYLLCEKSDLAEFVDYPLNKILTFASPSYLKQNSEKMAEPFKDHINCMFTAPYYFEYTAKGVDKAEAIATVFTSLGYTPEEMMAFGDAQNDGSMLSYVGCGIAMDNAVDSVKALADEVTLSNEEDGIAHSLYKHFPEIFH